MNQRPPIIGVIGSGQCESNIYELAEEVGQEIAKKGAVLVCGGLGGVMEAAAKGASSAGGLTVGVLPGHHSLSLRPAGAGGLYHGPDSASTEQQEIGVREQLF